MELHTGEMETNWAEFSFRKCIPQMEHNQKNFLYRKFKPVWR